RYRTNAAAVLHAAWALVVGRTSGLEDVVFGTVLFGRLQMSGGSPSNVGMFLNTLPLRVRLDAANVKELLEHTHRALIGLMSVEQAPLALAQRCSGVVGSAPLFTTILNYRHGSRSAGLDPAKIGSGINLLSIHAQSPYPITLSVDDFGTEFVLT